MELLGIAKRIVGYSSLWRGLPPKKQGFRNPGSTLLELSSGRPESPSQLTPTPQLRLPPLIGKTLIRRHPQGTAPGMVQLGCNTCIPKYGTPSPPRSDFACFYCTF